MLETRRAYEQVSSRDDLPGLEVDSLLLADVSQTYAEH
jgi:hypothetical protein